MNGYTNGTSALPAYDAQEIKKARRVVSEEESIQTEKTLHQLNGRVQELRERLERVLIPSMPMAGGNPMISQEKESGSPLTDRLRSFRSLANDSINTVEDILNRLDV